MREKKYTEAISYFQKAEELTPDNLADKMEIFLNTSVALSRSGDYVKAEVLLLEAIKLAPDNITLNFALIENSIRANDDAKTKTYVETLLKQFDKKQIKYGLKDFTDNPRLAPISKKLIAPVIEEMMR